MWGNQKKIKKINEWMNEWIFNELFPGLPKSHTPPSVPSLRSTFPLGTLEKNTKSRPVHSNSFGNSDVLQWQNRRDHDKKIQKKEPVPKTPPRILSKPANKKPKRQPSLKSTFAPTKPEIEKRPIVFFDITIDDVPVGTVFFELFNETVPKTAENFRALTTGKEIKWPVKRTVKRPVKI